MLITSLSGCVSSNFSNKLKEKEEEFDYKVHACRDVYKKKIGNYYNLSKCLDSAYYEASELDTNGLIYEEAKSVANARDPIYQAIDERKIGPEQGEQLLSNKLQEIRAYSTARQNKLQSDTKMHMYEINALRPQSCTYNNVYGTVYQHCF